MSLPDTPNCARFYCPGCEPDADPFAEILVSRWCEEHEPTTMGLDDGRASVTSCLLSSSGEASGDDCRGYAELIHRRAGQ